MDQALEAVERERFDVALLDVRINQSDTYVVADALSTRGIPFIFVSGLARHQLPPPYQHCAHIAKPFSPDAVLTVLDAAVAETGPNLSPLTALIVPA